jgi:predicted acyl esterase
MSHSTILYNDMGNSTFGIDYDATTIAAAANEHPPPLHAHALVSSLAA